MDNYLQDESVGEDGHFKDAEAVLDATDHLEDDEAVPDALMHFRLQ